jgi:hypothetical protein
MTLGYVSWNSFDSTYYTDGYRLGSIGDWEHECHQCRTCRKFFWGDEIGCGECLHYANKEGVRYSQTPDFDFDGVFLKSHCWRTPSEELYIRLSAWWEYSDSRKRYDYPSLRYRITATRRQSMLRILELLDLSKPIPRLVAAEIHRHLGDFKTFMRLLEFDFEPDYRLWVDAMRRLCEKRDRSIVKLEA